MCVCAYVRHSKLSSCYENKSQISEEGAGWPNFERTLIMFYKGQSLRDARQNFVKNKGQGLALRASRRDSKNWIHAVSFIRDTVILRLVLSLNLIKILTSFVPYLSLISTPIIDSEALH